MVCRQLHYTGKGKGRYMVSISKTGKGEERKMHNSGIISHVMKIMEFHVSVVLREATKIQYIIHFICASCMLIF